LICRRDWLRVQFAYFFHQRRAGGGLGRIVLRVNGEEARQKGRRANG
jgi:hypothetical protein